MAMDKKACRKCGGKGTVKVRGKTLRCPSCGGSKKSYATK